jgi:hypothetical protein
MTGSIEMARRIEAAETRLSLEMGEVSRRSGTDGAFALRVGSGAAVYCGPGAPMTKVIGVAIAEPLTDEVIDQVEQAFAPTGENPGWEIATFGDYASIRRLEGRGYRLQRIETVLGRDLTRASLIDPVPADIRIERGHDEEWARISVAGFSAAETVEGRDVPGEQYDSSILEKVVQQFAGIELVRRYVAFLHGQPAGAAAARVDAGVFQLCGAATLPVFRRRGEQTAMLCARLAEARAANCDLTVVTVEPGSRSQANIQRRGFVPLYSRLVMARES